MLLDYYFRTKDDQTPLELATISGQNVVVEELCKRGVDMAVPSSNSDPILWVALTTNQEDIASTLVKLVILNFLFNKLILP